MSSQELPKGGHRPARRAAEEGWAAALKAARLRFLTAHGAGRPRCSMISVAVRHPSQAERPLHQRAKMGDSVGLSTERKRSLEARDGSAVVANQIFGKFKKLKNESECSTRLLQPMRSGRIIRCIMRPRFGEKTG